MKFVHEFLSSLKDATGRLPRSLYGWYTGFMALLILAFAVPIALFEWLLVGADFLKTLFAALFIFTLIGTPWGIVLTIKRFHDFSQSGWLLLGVIVADAMLGIVTYDVRQTHRGIDVVYQLIDLVIPAVICFWPGTPGINRFGAPVAVNRSRTRWWPAVLPVVATSWLVGCQSIDKTSAVTTPWGRKISDRVPPAFTPTS
jgi:uncharacterized membrane protein YhaH (DUF805 family)